MRTADAAGPDHSPGRTAYMAELQCFLCGSAVGSIEMDGNPLPAHGMWHPPAGGAPRPVSDWRQLRCPRCGGALFAESIEAVARHDDSEELQREVPRRGRPPKWLVEQRRREREAAESSSG
ncbi:MAG: hypothetical protein M3336_10335 [Chloroflexota bacterium]|nr:hypothetical protein [Chloroflexota bacterium]